MATLQFNTYERLLMVRFITGGMALIPDDEYNESINLVRTDSQVAYCYYLALRAVCKKYQLGVESEENTQWYKKATEIVEKWYKEPVEVREWLYVLVAYCIRLSKMLLGFAPGVVGTKPEHKHRLTKMRKMWSELYEYSGAGCEA